MPYLGPFSEDWREEESQYPPFGPDIRFPSTPTGGFLKFHLKQRSSTSYTLFYIASTLGVSAATLWRRICLGNDQSNIQPDKQPNILQCGAVVLLALDNKLKQEHPEAMERFDQYMKAWRERSHDKQDLGKEEKREIGMDELVRRGDTLVCFWVLYHLRYPKAIGQPFQLESVPIVFSSPSQLRIADSLTAAGSLKERKASNPFTARYRSNFAKCSIDDSGCIFSQFVVPFH
jgi:hypothetical protein